MAIPTIDFSPFLTAGGGDEDGRKKAKDFITEACSDYGFFQIRNHGVPPHLITQCMELSKTFFSLPAEEKLKYGPRADAPLPAGYSKQPAAVKNEYFLMYEPQSGFNVLPENPPDFGNVLQEMFGYFRKTGELIEEIVNDCLGLPANFLKEYNDDRSSDVVLAISYSPSPETDSDGLGEHGDPNCITLLIQDDVGGLEVKKDGKWIPVVPAEDTIVVNIGDVIQVLSNKKFKSAPHRVVRPKERKRHSMAFSLNLGREKWVEPLPQFTAEIGKAAEYRGFVFKEYQALRLRNNTHPPARPEDKFTISHYAISQEMKN